MKNILAFGDSNTWGLVPGTKDRFPWGVRWTSLVQESLSDARVIEEGLCGRTTVFEDELRPLRKAVDALPMVLESTYPIDAAIVMLGTNDCKSLFNANAYTIAKGLEQVLDEISSYVTADKILVVSPIHLGEEVWREDKDPEFDSRSIETSKNLQKFYRQVAKNRGYNFLAASDYVGPSNVDEEHMDEEGHKRLAEAIVEKIQEMKIA